MKTETVPFLDITLTTIDPRTMKTNRHNVSGRFPDLEAARRYYFYAVSEIIEENYETGAETRHKIVGVDLLKGEASK